MADSVVVSGYETQEAPRRRILFPPGRLLFVPLVCVGYYLGALMAKSLTFPDSHLSLIWPPTAIMLAALLLAPARMWWMYLVALTPVHFFIQLQGGMPPWAVMSTLVGNFSQALLAATTVLYFNRGQLRFDIFRSIVVFTLCAVFLAPIVVSSLAAYLYVLSGWESDYWYVWWARILSNALSTLAIVPTIIGAARGITHAQNLRLRYFGEAAIIGGGLVIVGVAHLWLKTPAAFLLYAPLPWLLWAAVRFGVGGLSTSLLMAAFFIFTGTSSGQGPFAAQSPAENVLSLQVFLITISLPLMFLAALTEERRAKEKALSESEARYRALVMASADIVWLANERGEGFFVTPGWQSLTGQNEKEMRGFGWLDAVHAGDRERSRLRWEQAVKAKRVYENELRVRTRDGSYRHFHVHAVPILALDGSVHEWVGANADITERKQAEQALRESEERLGRTEKFSLVMVTQTDLEGRWLKVPPTLCELLGYTEGELLARRFYDVTHPDDIEANSTQRLRLIRGEIKSFDLEKRYIRKDGVIVWVDVNVSIVTDAQGTPVHFLSYIRDITARKRTELEAVQQRAELAHIARVSTMGELAASLAHELNQPLTAILSNAQAAQRFLAANPADLEDVREILKDIVQDNNRAGEVIRRMRALVKKEELEFEPLNLASVIGDVVMLVHSDAVLRNIRVLLEFSPGLPMVRGDRIQLQQVALNLLLNAFEAMKDCLANDREVVLRGDLDDARAVRVAVRDRGIALSSDKLDKIFEPFYTTKRDGLGMGLSICRSIIEAHGGRLSAENNPDRGATFYFTVPVKKRDEGRVSKERGRVNG